MKTKLIAIILLGAAVAANAITIPEDTSKSSTYTDASGYTYTKDSTSGNTYKYKEYFSTSTTYMRAVNSYGKILFEGYYPILSPSYATAKDVSVYKWNPCELCQNGGKWLLIDVIRITSTEGSIFHNATGGIIGADLHPATSPTASATPAKSSN